MIHDAADRLLAGKEGSEVVDYLREELHASAERGGRAFSVNTLKNYVSRTKALVLDRDYRNKDCDFQPLRAFEHPDVNYFLAATLKTQVQIQRKHRSPFSEPTWTDEMETAGDIIQDLCQSMNISEIQSSCEFKGEMERPFAMDVGHLSPSVRTRLLFKVTERQNSEVGPKST